MNSDSADPFLIICKQNFVEKITPANKDSYSKVGYLQVVELAKEYFNKNKYEEFAEFLKEGQYYVSLWAAHLLIEHGRPNKAIFCRSLCTILDHSENQLAEDVSNEEKEWLDSREIIIRSKPK